MNKPSFLNLAKVNIVGYEYGTDLQSETYFRFPNANYERGEGPDIEIYDVCNSTPDALAMRILIPLQQDRSRRKD